MCTCLLPILAGRPSHVKGCLLEAAVRCTHLTRVGRGAWPPLPSVPRCCTSGLRREKECPFLTPSPIFSLIWWEFSGHDVYGLDPVSGLHPVGSVQRIGCGCCPFSYQPALIILIFKLDDIVVKKCPEVSNQFMQIPWQAPVAQVVEVRCWWRIECRYACQRLGGRCKNFPRAWKCQLFFNDF